MLISSLFSWSYKFPGVEFDLNRIKHIAFRGSNEHLKMIPLVGGYNENGPNHCSTIFLEPYKSLESVFLHDDDTKLPTLASIKNAHPENKVYPYVPVVDGLLDHQRQRFKLLGEAVDKLSKTKKPDEKVVRRPKVVCRLGWWGVKNFDLKHYLELKKAQRIMEGVFEREKQRLLKIQMEESAIDLDTLIRSAMDALTFL